jgi:undecaprenyl-diphosphatase
MVLIPVIGANAVEIFGGGFTQAAASIGALPLVAGFLASFAAGTLACQVMIALVKRGNLIGFAVYCAALGLAAIGVEVF